MIDWTVKAIDQYERDIEALEEHVSSDRSMSLVVDTIMWLREKRLPYQCWREIEYLLWRGDEEPSFLHRLPEVLNFGEWLRLPSALNEILDELQYRIRDSDGYLRLCRICFTTSVHHGCEVSYFLTTDNSWTKEHELGERWLERSVCGEGKKMLWFGTAPFGSIARFGRLLRIIGDERNYTSAGWNGMLDHRVIDALMFRDVENLQ